MWKWSVLIFKDLNVQKIHLTYLTCKIRSLLFLEMLWSNHRTMQNHIPEERNWKLHSCKSHKIQHYLVQVNNSRQTCALKIGSWKCCKISTLHGTATFWVTFIKMPAFKCWHDWSVTGMAESAAIHWWERYKSGTNGLRGFIRVRSFLQNRIGGSHYTSNMKPLWESGETILK